MGLSLHHIDIQWNLRVFILNLTAYSFENQTSAMVRRFVDECLAEYELCLMDNIFVVTDNENKMKSCFQTAAKRVGCGDHYLNKVMEHAFTGKHGRTPEVSALFSSVKTIVVYLRRSHRQSKLSKKVQCYSETRFSGAFIMLQSFLDVFAELAHVLEREHLPLYADIDLALLQQVVTFMEPFNAVIEELSDSDRPTIHRVIPLRQYLIECCSPHIDDEPGVDNLKRYLRNDDLLQIFLHREEHTVF